MSEHNLTRRSRSRSRPPRARVSTEHSRTPSPRLQLIRSLGTFLDKYFDRHRSPAPSEVSADAERPASLPPPIDSLALEESGEALSEVHEYGREPATTHGPPERHEAVSFATPVATSLEGEPDKVEADALATELFGNQPPAHLPASWPAIMVQTSKSEVRLGLKEDLRNSLLAKYELSEQLSFLGPPGLNKEIIPNLSQATVTRDKHQVKLQTQVGASLNALGSGLSELAKLDLQNSLEAKAAMSKIVEGFKLLADLQYHLSRARRAFIVPSLNFLGKTVSDAAPIDDRLFGNNFAEDVNSAQSVERVAKKMARKPPPTSGPSTEICDSSPEEGLPPTESYQENTTPFEVTVNPLTDSAGRLSQFADQWRLITSDPQEPALSTLETEACDMEIQRLCTKGALAIVNPSKDQFLSSFFLISKSSGGMRFILNLKDLNSYITPPHFKMEDWRTVIRLMTLNCKMATIDLEDAYFGVMYAMSLRLYHLAYLQHRDSDEDCQENVNTALVLLSSLGFLINYKKSQLVPSSSCRYLGFVFNSDQQSLSIPPDRREKLHTLVREFAKQSRCRIRDFASLIGSLVSVCPAAPYGLLYTKRFEREKFLALDAESENYEAWMLLPDHLREDFDWWSRTLANPYLASIIHSGSYALEIYSDASLTGWGASCGAQQTHDPGSWAIDAFTLPWNHFYFYAFPPFILISRVLRKIIEDKAEGVLIVPWWPSQPWFPIFSRLLEQTSGVAQSFPGGRQAIRKAFQLQEVPSNALDTMLASLSQATIKQYERPLRAWWSFCSNANISPFSPSVEQALDFLSCELLRAGSYSTLNTARSAISLVSSSSIGNHALVRRFCRGANVLKPQAPRYDFIWDPAPVIAKLAMIYPYNDIPLFFIIKKLVLLLALGSGQHAQTLAAIKTSQIFSSPDKTIIKVPGRLKTSAPGRPQPLLIFPRFHHRPELCIALLLDHYLELTKVLRTHENDSLFISYIKPYKPVGVQTLSRWIRASLSDCGIQSEFFSAHSTRHAATSLAAKKGVSLDLIKRAAGWTGESRVFANFYNRPIVNPDDFANSVLSE
ncbi:uncharacterized protein [Cardiocondyla obscurior]|uniref:uncharacterized protein n=1 Tax=Cardiocondyla obscurior TaxID=286306 RepID=UPI003965831A